MGSYRSTCRADMRFHYWLKRSQSGDFSTACCLERKVVSQIVGTYTYNNAINWAFLFI